MRPLDKPAMDPIVTIGKSDLEALLRRCVIFLLFTPDGFCSI